VLLRSLLLVAVVAAVAGCGGQKSADSRGTTASTAPEPAVTGPPSLGCDVVAQCSPQLARDTLARCPASRLSPRGREARERLERLLQRIAVVDLHNERHTKSTTRCSPPLPRSSAPASLTPRSRSGKNRWRGDPLAPGIGTDEGLLPLRRSVPDGSRSLPRVRQALPAPELAAVGRVDAGAVRFPPDVRRVADPDRRLACRGLSRRAGSNRRPTHCGRSGRRSEPRAFAAGATHGSRACAFARASGSPTPPVGARPS
jgi:hypothetical protein